MKQACLWHAWTTAPRVCLRLEKKYRTMILLVSACHFLALRQGCSYLKEFSFWRRHDKLEQARSQLCDFGQVTLGLCVFSSVRGMGWIRIVVFKLGSSRSYCALVGLQNLQEWGWGWGSLCQARPLRVSLLNYIHRLLKNVQGMVLHTNLI